MQSVVILISGRGSNMQAIVEAALSLRVAAVISNRPGAPGLDFARGLGIETAVIDHREHASREAFEDALSDRIDCFSPDLICLAGFMRVLGDAFVRRYDGRMLNIHPSLLPAFPGLHTHRRALEEGVKVHGCTVHFVTPSLDHGPIVLQAAVPVMADDDEAALAGRVLRQEHRIYPKAVQWFVEGRLAIDNGRVRLAGKPEAQYLLALP